MYDSLIKKINKLRSHMKALSKDDMRALTASLRERVLAGEKAACLPEAFALIREVTWRTLGKEQYDVQMMAGIAIYNGKIAEAKTGEGKTISIYAPAFLEALSGKGVHVVTVNDYLAKRDADSAEKVFSYLGMTVGCVLHNDEIIARKKAYLCDITYVTNSEVGFDYLKDHIVYDEFEVVHRGLHYAIIDEVDSILIDEAKTPLIIAGNGDDENEFLKDVDRIVKSLEMGEASDLSQLELLAGKENYETGDFIKDEKESQVFLTEAGIRKVEECLNIDNYSDSNNILTQKAVNNSLRANYMMEKDVDYIVQDGKIEIVDSFTGRVLEGRRFSDGLHQAIEAKEEVPILSENVTMASVTFQSFFNKYDMLAGLTGTAMTSSKEFRNIYGLDVVPIPTNKPVIRKDLPDQVFKTKNDKWVAVTKTVLEEHDNGRPILIGTASVADSEIVSSLLTEAGLKHETLNAKNEAIEAGIIAKAGEFGAITVATNMAGRGTDILLDEKSREVGGLLVIGTERHESVRVDNQLRGRSGRQGDPGTSQFFVSLEDRIIAVYGDQSAMLAIDRIASEGRQYNMLSKLFTKAQNSIEDENRLARENLMKYEEVTDKNRNEIYEQRETILAEEKPEETIRKMFYFVSDDIVDTAIKDELTSENATEALSEFTSKVIDLPINIDTTGMKKEHLKEALRQIDDTVLQFKKDQFNCDETAMASIQRTIILRILDQQWVRFMSMLDYLKSSIFTRSYGHDPVDEFKIESVALFNNMVETIRYQTVQNYVYCSVNVGGSEDFVK